MADQQDHLLSLCRLSIYCECHIITWQFNSPSIDSRERNYFNYKEVPDSSSLTQSLFQCLERERDEVWTIEKDTQGDDDGGEKV